MDTPTPPDLLRMELEDLAERGYQPSYNGRPSCPFCANFIDEEETHTPDCILIAALASPDPSIPERPDRETPIGRVIRDVRRAIRDEPPRGSVRESLTTARPAELLAEALAKLPPGPYRVVWPDEQGGWFTVAGAGASGWAIPIVALSVQSVAEALADILNSLALAQQSTPESRPERRTHDDPLKRDARSNDADR